MVIDATLQAEVALRRRYIDLLRDALTMALWGAGDGHLVAPDTYESSADFREDGRDWPQLAHTMIGRRRIENLRFCLEDVLQRGVPGDFIETGVWRGGACVFARGIFAAYGETDRTVWVADSFEGLPPPDVTRYPADRGSSFHEFGQLAIDVGTVRATFERYGLLDDQVRFLKGWFKDTLPTAPIEQLAVARLDGDMYESTMDALTSLYPKLSVGGYLIIDDYSIPACSRAVHDYRRAHGIDDPIEVIDWTGVFWKKHG